MPAPSKALPPAECGCGCGEALPLVRRADKLYVSVKHWQRANLARENARRARARKTPAERVKRRVLMRKWRKKNPERWNEIARRANAKFRAAPGHAAGRRKYDREWRRRKAGDLTAQPRPSLPPSVQGAGLAITSPRRLLSDWREDAAQDRLLAELERAAARRAS